MLQVSHAAPEIMLCPASGSLCLVFSIAGSPLERLAKPRIANRMVVPVFLREDEL